MSMKTAEETTKHSRRNSYVDLVDKRAAVEKEKEIIETAITKASEEEKGYIHYTICKPAQGNYALKELVLWLRSLGYEVCHWEALGVSIGHDPRASQ